MNDLAYAITLCFVTLGPLKTIPAFFMVSHAADRRTVLALAVRSTVLATLIVLFVALVASGVLVTWRVSLPAMTIAGGIVLLMSATKTLASFVPVDTPAPAAGQVPALDVRWTGRPVLSPLVIPAIVPPVGVVVILLLAGATPGDLRLQAQLVALLLAMMALNFVAMLCAGPIMRVVGMPVLQVVGWVFSALQAGLAVQAVIDAVRGLR